jgi:hypothetical protein
MYVSNSIENAACEGSGMKDENSGQPRDGLVGPNSRHFLLHVLRLGCGQA